MAKRYSIPGVYIEEVPTGIIGVDASLTSVPVFVGFTEKTTHHGASLLYKPVRIVSFGDFVTIFGTIPISNWEWNPTISQAVCTDLVSYRLYYALKLYFDNGGGSCYVVSTGVYRKKIDSNLAVVRFEKALQGLSKQSDPNLLVWADAHLAGETLSYQGYQQALQLGKTKKDWLVLIDLYSESFLDKYQSLRNSFEQYIGQDGLKFGAAYYPYLQTVYRLADDESRIRIKVTGKTLYLNLPPDHPEAALSLFATQPTLYTSLKMFLYSKKIILPASSVVAGLMCQKPRWKAPANLELQSIEKPLVEINQATQDTMTVPASGKSVNTIRNFTGRGVLVWGARTLAGNDNEWRYIPSVRLAGAIEKAIENILASCKTYPNNQHTWSTINNGITNFLDTLWRQGALVGEKSTKAYFCHIGLGRTMTQQDIEKNKLIVEVGLAFLKPAEFVIIRVENQRK